MKFNNICAVTLLLTVLGCHSKAGVEGDTSPTASSPLVIVSYGGGAYQASHQEAFIKPFAKISALRCESTTWNAEYGKFKAMVKGDSSWDVLEITAGQLERAKKDGLLQNLTINPDGRFLPGTTFPNAIGNVYWGTVLAYDKDAFPSGGPKTWADFWDTTRFPGDRALYDDPRGNLEFALLADGVSLSELYPLDVDRAFKKLDQIKPHVRVWWSDGSQPVQLLLSKTVVASPAWNGRIFASAEAKKRISYAWGGAALELDFWVIPANSRKVAAASRFIAYASTAEAMAKQAQLIGYGPVNRDAFKYIPADIQSNLPTYDANFKASFVVNAQWWADNEEAVRARWTAWKIK